MTLFLMLVMLLPLSSWAGDMTVTWNANTEADLAGYKLHIGTVSKQYTDHVDVGKVTSYKITKPDGQTYYIAATAYDTSGNESDYSNEVSKLLPAVTAIVKSVMTDVDGATVTITGNAKALRYGDDFTAMTVLPEFVAGSTTYRLKKRWKVGTTFTCVQAQQADDAWTEQGCNKVTPAVDPPPPPDPLPPPPPPPPKKPAPVQGLTVAGRPSTGEVLLSWQPAQDAETYAIKRVDQTTGKLVEMQRGIVTTSAKVALPSTGRRMYLVCSTNVVGEACPLNQDGVWAKR